MQHPALFAAHALQRRVKRFLADASGAVTVDWVAISAAVIAMVVVFMAGFTSDVNTFLVNLMASL